MSGWLVTIIVCGFILDLWSARRERAQLQKEIRALDRRSREILRHLRD